MFARSLLTLSIMVSACACWAAEPPPDEPVAVSREARPPLAVLPKVESGQPAQRELSASGFNIKLDLSTQVLRLAAPDEESWRTADERVRAGDIVELIAPAPLRAGQKTIASLAKGRRLRVSQVQGEWAGTAIVASGQRQTGWLRIDNLKFITTEPALAKTPLEVSGDPFVSGSILAQKAKQFDDGLYAAVELAAQEAAGELGGKRQLLETLASALEVDSSGRPGGPVEIIHGAYILGGGKGKTPGAAQKTIDAFLAAPLRSKPIGFYTWSPELSAIFQQDRLLQSELTGKDQVARLLAALKGAPQAAESYDRHLNLAARLTNPLSKPDLRASLAAFEKSESSAPDAGVYFLPPSRGHETDLVMKLFGGSQIPEGFELFAELISRIRSGELDLTPSEQSGWYDYQTWSLAPLVTPEKTPEAQRLQFDETYKKRLEQLFRGVFAMNRETHVKQLDFPAPGEAAGEPIQKVDLYVHPDLNVEPLAEHYLRRAAGYRFVSQVLEETFGKDAVAEMKRQTADGPLEMGLAEELTSMESLFIGAYATACRQLGLPAVGGEHLAVADSGQGEAEQFLSWGANAHLDVDLGRDARMMVPVFFDRGHGKTKVWALLGWEARRIDISFAAPPTAVVLDGEGKPAADERYDLHFPSISYNLAYPVTAEVYVSKLLDRSSLRCHCGTYVSKEAILKNLE